MENALANQSSESPSTVTKQQNASPNANVYLMPITTPRTLHAVPGVRCLSVTQIILGCTLVILGIAGAVLKARGSYTGNPIWTGLLFFVVTGILGLFVYLKKTNLCMNIAFLVMCIISCFFAVQLMLTSWTFAVSEQHLTTLDFFHNGTHYDYSRHYYEVLCSPRADLLLSCNIPAWKRAVVGTLIGFVALASFIIFIVSCSVTLYGSFTCCYQCCSCCRSSATTQSPYTIQYTPQGVVLMSLDGQQVITPQLLPTQQPAVVSQQTISGVEQSGNAAQPIIITSGSTTTGTDDQDGGHIDTESKALIETGVELTEDKPSEKVADDPENWQTFEK